MIVVQDLIFDKVNKVQTHDIYLKEGRGEKFNQKSMYGEFNFP